jgi:hypothetical protein
MRNRQRPKCTWLFAWFEPPSLNTAADRRLGVDLIRINAHAASTSVQHADSNNVVHPPVRRAARLKEHMQADGTVIIRWSEGLNEDVGPVVGLQLIARVGVKDALAVSQRPVCANTKNLACGAAGCQSL